MTVRYVKGNLLNAKEDIIAHQVNCQGVMGSGVAKQIKDRYPKAFEAYKVICSMPTPTLLGQSQTVLVEEGKYVSNLFGQFDYNRVGSTAQQTNVLALGKSLVSLANYAKENGLSIALPYKIGSDRGGADWKEVKDVIEQIFDGNELDVTIYSLTDVPELVHTPVFDIFKDRTISLLERAERFIIEHPEKEKEAIKLFLSEINDDFTKQLLDK